MYKYRYTVVDLLEEEYGCEGIPDGEEAMVTLLLKGEDGTECSLTIPDRLAYEKNIGPGELLTLDENHTIL